MVKYRNICAVVNCQKNGSKEPLLMHSLDSASKLGKIWYHRAKYGLCYDTLSENINKLPFEPSTKRIFICESHFVVNDYECQLQDNNGLGLQVLGKKGRKRLKKSAIPSVNLPINPANNTNYNNSLLQDQNSIQSLEFLNLIDSAKDDLFISESDDDPTKLLSTDYTKMNLKKRKKSYIMFPRNKKKSEILTNGRKTSSSDSDTITSNDDQSPSPIIEVSQQPTQAFNLIKNEKHCIQLMKSLYSDEALMDVFLTVNNKTARAHRAILRQASGYFRQVLSLDTTLECEIRLRDIEYDVLVKILRFIYMGEVSMAQDMLPQFFKAAKILEIFSLTAEIQKENCVTDQVKQEDSFSSPEDVVDWEESGNNVLEQTPECHGNSVEDHSQETHYVITETKDVGSQLLIADDDMAAPLPDLNHEEGINNVERSSLQVFTQYNYYNVASKEGIYSNNTDSKEEIYSNNTCSREEIYSNNTCSKEEMYSNNTGIDNREEIYSNTDRSEEIFCNHTDIKKEIYSNHTDSREEISSNHTDSRDEINHITASKEDMYCVNDNSNNIKQFLCTINNDNEKVNAYCNNADANKGQVNIVDGQCFRF